MNLQRQMTILENILLSFTNPIKKKHPIKIANALKKKSPFLRGNLVTKTPIL